MTFENGKTIIRLRINVFIATILFIVYLFFAYFGKSINFPVFGLSDTELSLILVAIYLIIAFYPMILGYNYIYLSDDGPSIILRYYSVGLFKGKKRSIEIAKKSFVGYKRERFLITEKISLIQRLDLRDATYPPVSITSLFNSERQKIFATLDKYASKK